VPTRVTAEGLTFANGEDRQVLVPVEKPATKWEEPETPFGMVLE
jgi:hypothetical protein